MTQSPAAPIHPVPDDDAGTPSSRHTVLAGVIAGGVLIGLFSAAFAISGATLRERAEADVVGSDHDASLASDPAPTGTQLLSAKVQAATMQDILPSAMPILVDAPVTDEAGVLSPEEYARVSDAVSAVEEETTLRLFVVYLETFDGIAPEDWADATATKSGLMPEELLLAIATADHVQGLSVDVNGPVSSRDHKAIIAAARHAVNDGAWVDAATDAADAAIATRDDGASAWWKALALLVVVAIGAALAAGWWYVRHRRPARRQLAEAHAGPDDRAVLAAQEGLGTEDGGHDLPDAAPRGVPEPVGAVALAAGEPAASAHVAATTTVPAAETVAPDLAPAPILPARTTPAPTPPARSLPDRAVPDRAVPDRAVPSSRVPAPATMSAGGGRSAGLVGPTDLTDDYLTDDDLTDDDLGAQVDGALVTLDDALRTSAQELELARARARDGAVHDLEIVLADATEMTRDAFTRRAALQAADEDTWRDVAREALRSCAEASKLLDSGTVPLEDSRRLKARANRLLNESWQRAGEFDRRIEQAREQLPELAGIFPADAVAPVADNVELADQLVTDARRAIDTGRAAGAKRDRAFAAAAARSAQNALGLAERLLNEVDSARADLDGAMTRLDKAVTSLAGDVADAERVAGGDPQAAMARTTARAALKQVEISREDADPFTLLARIAAAEGALDRALARHREPSEVNARAAALVRDTLSRLDVRLRQLDALITTRRAVVGPDARMHRSEAARLTDEARDARARSDAAAALDLARRADAQASQALTAARRDAAADDVPTGMPLAGINLTLDGRRGHGAGSGARGGLLGLLTRSPGHVRTGGIGGGFGGGGFGSGRTV
ncbi:TPM domain-containing protein [Myceligenerans indicum]|uniref:TPM domain-containing protein n=1 Tax=Myceligenerans indicum TaxID=2593663 RepID=A0ABS1LMT4_9MICO|nr:TPM domain-containing protein [Myceligenerans indicum]MBL0887521.1 hypothetical protein [Myceligenerans indicum]